MLLNCFNFAFQVLEILRYNPIAQKVHDIGILGDCIPQMNRW
uniref:Uncharacterized protein n=1 Tax=Planktothrix paucivesiculata PCC 9631 TaxID=671071 RepID=A0A0K0PEG3_9CYAN|nr:hypothetical protein [Planktothrix paucivesiculata PCC 9631]